jgi:DNA-binding beta-propeller fold protein YncE
MRRTSGRSGLRSGRVLMAAAGACAAVGACAWAAGPAPIEAPAALPFQWLNADGDLPSDAQIERRVMPAELFDVSSILLPTDFPTFDFRLCGTPAESDIPSGVGFTTDGSTIIIAGRESKNLVLLNAATRAFIREIPLSGSPVDLAVSSDGIHAATANVLEDTVSIVNLVTGAELGTVPVGRVPGVVEITPNGQIAVVGNTTSADFSIIDIASRTELRRIPGGSFSLTLSGNPESGQSTVSYGSFTLADNDTIVHPRRFLNPASIALINLNTGVLTSLLSALTPTEAAVRADGRRAYVTHTGSARVISEVDVLAGGAGGSILRTIASPADLWGPIAVNPGGTRAAVGIQNASHVVDLPSGVFGPILSSTVTVNQYLTTADGQHALAVGFAGALVSFATQNVVAITNQAVSTNVGAISPIGQRAALVSNIFGEDLVVVGTNGASATREAFLLTGPEPEGDRARTAAISDDGTRGVVVSNFSDTATVFNMSTKQPVAYIKTGERPAEVDISPDGTRAVVANLDATFATVINLTNNSSVNVPISRRASQVEFSNDSRYAYVAVLADGDGVWRIDLQTNTVAGPKLATGDMGSVGYSYSQTSGMTISPDGNTLVVCGSFTNNLTYIDTQTWSVVRTLALPAGGFPVEAAFSADGTKIYVASRNDDRVHEVSNAGAGSSLLRTFVVGDQPWKLAPNAANTRLYVTNWANRNIGVVDLVTGTQTSVIPLPDFSTGFELRGSDLFVTSGNSTVTAGGTVGIRLSQDGELTQIDLGTNTVSRRTDLNLAPAGLAVDPNARRAIIAVPAADGALLLASCPADFNQDGTVDFFDYLDFVAAFDTENPSADFNGDNTVDFFDYLDFVAAFDIGCD